MCLGLLELGQGSFVQGTFTVAHPAFAAAPAVSVPYDASITAMTTALEQVFGAGTISVGFRQQWPLPFPAGPGWNGGYRWVWCMLP